MSNRTKITLYLTAITLVFLSVGAYLFLQNTNDAQTVVQERPATIQGLLDSVNQERAKAGVDPLVIDERLNQSAQKKADEIVSTKNFSHVNADGVHGYQYAIDYTGDDCVVVGENYTGNEDFYSIATVEKSIYSWMNSDSHRKALLNSEYTHTGFGVTPYAVVEHFCKQ